jgi:NADH dehydrogenase
MATERVVIIGAGFGGLRAARRLAGQGLDVLLIDQHNYHCFQPLLYQVATAGLEPEQIAYPIRAIIRRWRGVRFLLARVERIDRASRTLQTTMGPVEYDELIVAAGSATNFFGMQGVARHSFGLKSLEDAERLRNHILRSFESAAYETDPARRAALHTFVIVGGGPTGVELAGALRELVRHVLVRDYPGLRENDVTIILLEATDKILAMLPASLQRRTLERLRAMRVDVRFNTAVVDADAEHVHLKDGASINAHTLIWAAGVRGVELAGALEEALARGNRVAVLPTLNLADDERVWVIGDLAAQEQNGAAHPQVAQVAIQQAETAAANILARRRGRPERAFSYRDLGTMATIGRNAAVARIFGVSLWGFPAWVIWLFVHLMSLVGFRNRLFVLINWAYYYFFYERAVRIITSEPVAGGR